MMRNENVIIMARQAEKVAGDIRTLLTHYDVPEVTNRAQKLAVLRFAGALCSMASSVLCEFYEQEDSQMRAEIANGILREWGMEELI